ncbi:hypothetical protein [Dysgonomonas macrotermitis]|uniref:Uncharacterized protein n=1 Tax=Dysgonomonas macrotermitis TaxID=1346286 RepID=A0A1M5CAK3_9BACT|nr:hypothetical protein [Dysgonomonas macrotermitis]SHF51783.1 hypothetical protein SAMN05444362_10796 [Dysgonomonas macrotermitis]
MNFEIDNAAIEASFDRIAKEILTQKALYVNETVFRFTEIEFYYFNEGHHPDEYTHEHNRIGGEWRYHNQGIDITLGSNDTTDGGILIRGVCFNGKYVNGPRKIWQSIFEAFGKVTSPTTFQLKDGEKRDIEIIRTFRQLPNKIEYPEFLNKHYRYLVELDNLDLTNTIKNKIRQHHSILK